MKEFFDTLFTVLTIGAAAIGFLLVLGIGAIELARTIARGMGQ